MIVTRPKNAGPQPADVVTGGRAISLNIRRSGLDAGIAISSNPGRDQGSAKLPQCSADGQGSGRRDVMFLMNQWYAAALPSELGDKPLARTICSKAIVMYR